jgi:hypothetical protein
MLSTDGSRAIIITAAKGNTRLTTITLNDASQGAVNLAGDVAPVFYNADGSRAVVVATGAAGNTTVAVFNATTGTQMGTSLTFNNASVGIVDFSTNRVHLAVNSSTNGSLVTIDTAAGSPTAGTVIGSENFTGRVQSLQFNQDRTRVVVVAQTPPSSGGQTTTVAIINTVTGRKVGPASQPPPLSFTGEIDSVVITQDRVVVAYQSASSSTGQLAMFDISTGAQVGQTRSLPGRVAPFPDALLAYNATTVGVITGGGGQGSPETQLSLFSLVNSQPIGTTTVFSGEVLRSVQYSQDRTRAYLVMTDANGPNTPTTTVAVVDTATGAKGVPVTFVGDVNSLVLNTTQTRAVVTYTDAVGAAHAVVMDSATGTQVGQTIDLPGQFTDQPIMLSTDGSRAIIITAAKGNTRLTTITLDGSTTIL